MFLFLAVGAVALFSMVAVTTWADARRKERESYYKNDMLKKLADTPGPGATSALELMREEARLETLRTRQGLKIGGMVTMAGLGGFIFLMFRRDLKLGREHNLTGRNGSRTDKG